MEKHFKRTLITTALPYANGPVHIGHLAGVYVPADIYARYLRLKGEEVLMIGGSDEPWGTHHVESEEGGDHAAGCGGSLPRYYQEIVRGVRYHV